MTRPKFSPAFDFLKHASYTDLDSALNMLSTEKKETASPQTVRDLSAADIRQMVVAAGAAYTMPYEILIGKKGFERTFLSHSGWIIEIDRIHPDTRDARVVVRYRQGETRTLLNPTVFMDRESIRFTYSTSGQREGEAESLMSLSIHKDEGVTLIDHANTVKRSILHRA